MEIATLPPIAYILRALLWIWRKVRMLLPVSDERKVAWNLADQLEQIEWAIEETDAQHFEQELRGLYPRLDKFGMKIPLVDSGPNWGQRF